MSKPLDLYKALKIRRNASKATIKRAFRKMAMAHHPDRSGEREKFEEVKLAYSVLMDDAARAHYDATGEVKAQPAVGQDTEVIAILCATLQGVLQQVIGHGGKPEQEDLLRMMRAALANTVAELRGQKDKANAIRAKLAVLVGRFTVEEGENFLDITIQAQIRPLEEQLKHIESQLHKIQEASSFLDKFRFRADAKEVLRTLSIPTSTTGGFAFWRTTA